jgi:NADPH-dependent ferric siderophore reductase
VPGRPLHTFEVVRSEQVTSHMIRIVLGSGGFDTFTPSEYTDSYVKLVFVADGVDMAALPGPLTLDSFAGLPAAERPVVRTMTVRRADPLAREIAIDVAVHGEHGTAGQWAPRSASRWKRCPPTRSARCSSRPPTPPTKSR